MPKLYKHNQKGTYGTFYGKKYPYIVEYVFNQYPDDVKVFSSVKLDVQATVYDADENEYRVNDEGFFDQAVFYTTKQCSGNLSFDVQDKEEEVFDFFDDALEEESESLKVSKKEGVWHINGFRNNVIDTHKPFFSKKWDIIKDSFPIDKMVNEEVIDYNKAWDQSDRFRDKYLIARLVDTNLDNTKQLTVKVAREAVVESRR